MPLENQYEILEWDSNFLGLKVGRIKQSNLSEEALSEILNILESLRTDLIYYSSKIALNIETAGAYQVRLVDKKRTYTKGLTEVTHILNCNVIEYLKDYPDKKLLELAVESGKYSRFNLDKKIGRAKYEEMYKLWIINSVNKRIAQKVLVCDEDNEITGFVTLGEKNSRADIGIIAVDAAHRGKGIGKCLVLKAEDWFINQGYKMVQVVTQADNLAACRLYEECGYRLETEEHFYHLWHKKHGNLNTPTGASAL